MSDAPAVPHRVPVGATDTLTLTVGNKALTGWQRVSVTRPLAAIPASFDLEVTEKFPNKPDIDIRPGDPCEVKIGNDLVLTGYVDHYAAQISPQIHSIRVSGRSKSQDLVDCSAAFGDMSQPGFQVVNSNALGIAKQLAAPYNVEIQSTAGDGPEIPQFNINLGETPWEIIDRVTKYSQMLVYDQPDGSVMLANVGTELMASGVSIGDNIESADVTLTMDQRFSDYEGHLTSILTFGTDAGSIAPGVGDRIHDAGVPRFRLRYVISEQSVLGAFIVKDRAVWEMNYRMGRSYQMNVVVDSWRDAKGTLWEPNKLVPINADVLKLRNVNYIIGQVTYLRDESGQHAQLLLMPPEAYFVEPVGSLGLVTSEDAQNASATNPAAKQVDLNEAIPTGSSTA